MCSSMGDEMGTLELFVHTCASTHATLDIPPLCQAVDPAHGCHDFFRGLWCVAGAACACSRQARQTKRAFLGARPPHWTGCRDELLQVEQANATGVPQQRPRTACPPRAPQSLPSSTSPLLPTPPTARLPQTARAPPSAAEPLVSVERLNSPTEYPAFAFRSHLSWKHRPTSAPSLHPRP